MHVTYGNNNMDNKKTFIGDLCGKECNLYLPSIKPDHAFFRLGRNSIVLSDGCRRFDFEPRGQCVAANDFYNRDYLDNITWLGPFHCSISSLEFISSGDDDFNAGDVIATIDDCYDWIHSDLYNDNHNFLENLY
jgi:hypothetical protein